MFVGLVLGGRVVAAEVYLFLDIQWGREHVDIVYLDRSRRKCICDRWFVLQF